MTAEAKHLGCSTINMYSAGNEKQYQPIKLLTRSNALA
ncbi:hypothetical protein LMG28727_06199 [Paraburkholderia kirstenboschensis]|nr:hypothetical protein LMG28727_06199 [Paraburkholderia kirstenboschensis]